MSKRRSSPGHHLHLSPAVAIDCVVRWSGMVPGHKESNYAAVYDGRRPPRGHATMSDNGETCAPCATKLVREARTLLSMNQDTLLLGPTAIEHYNQERRARGSTGVILNNDSGELVLSRRYRWCGEGLRLSWTLAGSAVASLVVLQPTIRIIKTIGANVDLPCGDQDGTLQDLQCGSTANPSDDCFYLPWPNDRDGKPMPVSPDLWAVFVLKVQNNNAAAGATVSVDCTVVTRPV